MSNEAVARDYPQTHRLQVVYGMEAMLDAEVVENLALIFESRIEDSHEKISTRGAYCLALCDVLGGSAAQEELGLMEFSAEKRTVEKEAFLAELRKRIIDRQTAQGRLF